VNQLQFSRPASEDLKKICHDMASINARAAAAFVNGIEETCRLCVEHPEMSQPCDELSPGLKFLPTEGYVIFHHRVGMATEIVRILRDPRIVGASETPAAGAASGSFVEFAASLKELENRYGDLDEQKFYRAAELKPLDRVYHVPRKFGTGSLLVVITFFAAIFAVMRLFMAPPAVMGFVGLQVVAAGVMQWTMAKHPRLASALAGAVLLPVSLISIAMWEGDADEAVSMIAATPCTAIPGALCGYCAGTLIAGVFMLMELADEWIGGKKTADTAFDLEDPLAEDSEGDEAGARSPASDG
jgi:plasmid stabilization system protein ParE